MKSRHTWDRPVIGDVYQGTDTKRGRSGNANYDVTADGQRFIVVKAAGQKAAPTQINVVLNWYEELKQRVPIH